jgi:N-acetylneuraminic acid mutarotase
MVQIDEKTVYIHNGHDNDNEKISDMWKFDLLTNQWTQIEQRGDVPPGRNGHSLQLYNGFLIMFGGILEITKESEDIYIF